MPAGLPVTDPNNIKIAGEFCLKAKKNDVEGMKNFLHYHPGFNINTPFQGFTALHYTCKEKALEATEFLIRLGAKISQQASNESKTTPLDLCKADAAFEKKITEVQKTNDSHDPFGSFISSERNTRVQLGDLVYPVEVSPESPNEQIKTLNKMLYEITGKRFKLCLREVGKKSVVDAVFDEKFSGDINVALSSAGLPNEYVNSRYLIVTDVTCKENLKKLVDFYNNPLNRYNEEELRELQEREKNRKETGDGGLLISLKLPDFILKKYYDRNPDGQYVYSEKTDPASKIYFARQEHKRNLGSERGLYEKAEMLAQMARESLEKSFGPSRPNELAKAEGDKPVIAHAFAEKKQMDEIMKRNVSDCKALMELLKKYQTAKDKDVQKLPSPELAFRRAAATGNVEDLKKLIKWVNDLDTTAKGDSNKSALDYAKANGKQEAITFLLELQALPPLRESISVP